MSLPINIEASQGTRIAAICNMQIGRISRDCKNEFREAVREGVFIRLCRSEMKKDIEEYWIKRNLPAYDLMGLYATKEGVCKHSGYFRTDVLVFYVKNFCEVYIECNGDMIADWNAHVVVDAQTAKALELHIKELLGRGVEREYIETERRFLAARPWEQIVGLSPQEAIAKLTELGF